jgi:hypothetical protein
MAYQDDFRNKVLAALKAKNLAVDISQEATQQAIVEEAQSLAKSESKTMSSAEMKSVLEDVAKELSSVNKQFTAKNYDFTAFEGALEGPLTEGEGSYSGGGIAVSVANKDIIIIPANGGLGAAGSATSVNSISQIDFKYIANPNAYATFDPREVKASLFNWGERVAGNTYDTPVLGIGGAWNGVSYAPTPQWGVGNSFGSGVGGSINQLSGFGQIIFFKPASSTIYASLYNDVAISSNFADKYLTLIGYNAAVPGNFPSAGFAISFGGIGGSGPLAISGAASNAQSNQIKFLSPLTISNSTAANTLTLGLSSSTSTVQNFVGGGTAQYTLSTTTSSFAQGDLFYASGTGHVTLTKLAIGGNNTYLTSNGSVPSWTGTIAANTVAVNAATGTTILYPLLNNIAGSGAAISTDIDFNVDPGANILRYATGSFYVGTAVSSPTHTGAGSLVTYTSANSVVIKPGADTTTAIALQKTNGTNILVVDTTNNRIGINMTPGSFALDVTGSANLSTGNAYNINGTSVLSNNTLGTGVVTSSLTTVGVIGSGTWSATAITTNYGGTGFQTYAVGDVLYASTTNLLSKLTIGTVNQVLLSNGTIPTWSAATGLTVGTAFKITTAQTNVATTLYPLFADAATGSIGASIDTDIVYNAAGNILTVPSVYSGTALSSLLFTNSGNVSIKPGANSTTGIQLDNLAGQPVLNVDTTNSRVSIGSNVSVPSYTLDVSGDTNISTGSVFRINGTSVLSNNTLGSSVVTSSLTTVGVIGTGVWNATAIGTTYGGTGSNLSPTASIGNSNRIHVSGNTGQYATALIDNASSGNLLVSGGALAAPTFTNSTNTSFTFGGSSTLTINNAVITTGTITGTPTNGNDIVNKTYADSISAGLDIHDSARLATISAIGGSYRQSGTAGTLSGFGDYIIATTPAALIGSDAGFDVSASGIALTNGQRVLVKDGVLGGYASGTGAFGAYPTTFGGFAASWVANGIYTVASYGGAATSGWVLVRATDSDNQGGFQELTGGTFTFVEEGVTYADNAFVCTNDTQLQGSIGFGSTQISWSPFSGGASLTAGQGIAKTGNTLATNFNFTNDGNNVSGITYQGFAIGGARSGGVGFSSRTTLTVTAQGGANAVAASTLTLNTTGFTLSGGATARSLTVQGTGNVTLDGGGNTLTLSGSSITLTGGGNTLTLSTNSTLSLNSQTLTLSSNSGNLTFTGSANNATTQNIITSGVAQYQLSTPTNSWTVGDMYYGSGTAFSALTRLAFGTGTGTSVLIRSDSAPVWGTIQLGSSNFVSGVLGITNGGTNSQTTPTSGAVAYGTGTAYAFTLSGTGDSVLISNGTIPIWSSINLASTNAVRGTLPVTNGGTGAASFTGNGILYGNSTSAIQVTGAAANSILVTSGANVPSLSTDIPTAVTIGTAYIYRAGGTDVAIADGGTNSSASPTAGAIAYGTGTAYAFTLAGTAGSVLISTAGGAPLWNPITLSNTNSVSGTLAIANGGTNAAAANFTANGVVIYDGTRLTSATGLTMTGGTGLSVTGTVRSSGGFFVGANSVVTSITPSGGSAIYGAITIAVANTNPNGALSVSGNSQTITITGPGTGITGTGIANQVPYYSATSTLTGNVGLVYNPTAATGVGLSVNVNATSGTILRVNSSAALTSGLLIDVDNNGTQAFSVDFKGMTSIAAASGNTALVMTGGRTVLAPATSNYASIGFNATGTNPSSPNIGDLWFNGTNLYFRRDGSTNFDLLVGSVSGSGTANRIAKWNTTTALTDSNISDAGFGMTITSGGSIATAGSGATALLTLQTLSGDNSLTDRYFVRGVTSAGARLFSIDTAGNLRATTKSFDIPHPTKEGSRLVYGVLEGPEHGVYHRGTVEGKGVIQVNLPEYWHKLVGDQYTIQLTPWGNYNVCIESKTENYFTIQLVGDFLSRKFKNIKVDYIVHGSRLDAPLETEQ